MAYLVLARKYRPQEFTQLIGQEHISTTLLNAFKQKKLGQAYLFTGTRGVGKTSAARIFAKALRCETASHTPGIPCHKCTSCQEITEGRSLDVLEIDGASNNGVDNVREIRENVKFMPARGQMKVYIIDEVHMLTGAAFNALLKTLEEPPPHVTFILATTEIQKIPATILSRCQRFDFKRVPQLLIHNSLTNILKQEAIQIAPDAVRLIARRAEGSMRDALSALDQVLALSGNTITVDSVTESLGLMSRAFIVKMVAAVFENKIPDAIQLLQQAFESGVEMKILVVELAETLRNTMLLKLNIQDTAEILEEEKRDLEQLIINVSPENIQAAFRILSQSIEEVARSPFPKATVEMLLIRIARLGELSSISTLLKKVSELEKKVTVTTAPVASAEPIKKMEAKPSTNTWHDFVQYITQMRPNIGALLEHAVSVTEPADWRSTNIQTIQIGFREKNSFFFNQAQTKPIFSTLEQLLQSYLGITKSLQLIKILDQVPNQKTSIMEAKQQEKNKSDEAVKQNILSNPAIRDTQEILGAEFISYEQDK